MLSMVWANQTAESTNVDTFMKATVPTSQNHTEDKISLYGAHNFIVISGKQTFGLFVDYPGKLKV